MTHERNIKGICLKVGPLGETDRLLTFLSDEEGVTRFAAPGARKPRSKLAAAAPLTFLELQVIGRRGLRRVKQIKILHSFSNVGQNLETLAASQALAEMCLMLVGDKDPVPGMLDTVLIHWERLEGITKTNPSDPDSSLAIGVQALFHLIALGGYAIPLQECCRTGIPLIPPIGQWEWRCSLLPEEGFAIGSIQGCEIQLNPSELALLQRLLKPNLPTRRDGKLMGPRYAWLKLLKVVECWVNIHLQKKISALTMLREALNA